MTATSSTQLDARRAALSQLFDHAALFPPASMTMPDALAEDERVRAGGEAWLVRRFVCPLSRLEELGATGVPLSIVLDADADGRLDDPRVEAVEVPPGRAPVGLPGDAEVYVERPLADLGWLDDVAAAGLRAKARCGGASVPPVEHLAAFVRRCRDLGVGFKATAGLHHPVRRGEEHGFLNLLAAAVFGDEEDALAEPDPSAFALDAGGFSWRGRTATGGEVSAARERLLVAIGSCSIGEPVDDLYALRILPA